MITYEQYCGFANKMKEIETAILNGEIIAGEVWDKIVGDLDLIATESNYEDAGRWTIPVDYIFKLDGHYFLVWNNCGLTEYQEDVWEDQAAIEVRPKTITVTRWEAIDND